MTETILIIDDDAARLRMTDCVIQQNLYYRTATARSGEDATERLRAGGLPVPGLVVVDGSGALEWIRIIRSQKAHLPILAFIPYGENRLAARVAEAGASDFLTKPVTVERLHLSLQHLFKMQRMSHYIAWLERRVAGHMDFTDIVGENPSLKEALIRASEAAAIDTPVWISGEPGTGKELFARAIHGSSDRVGKPFVVVNCEALSEAAAEAVLFGREDAAANGNGRMRFSSGRLRDADRGTLLLEEVQMLSPSLQLRLAGMLESGTLSSTNGESSPLDVRIICSGTLRPECVPAGFDARLHRALCGTAIHLPSLSERKEDVALLAEHFVTMYAVSENKFIKGLTERALKWLTNASWPGNVHQLANTLWRAVLLCDGDMLDAPDLQMVRRSKPASASGYDMAGDGTTLLDDKGRVKTLKSVQEEAIRFALQQANGCMTRAARNLGIGRSTLYRKVGELELSGYISRANQTTRPAMKLSSLERS